MAIELTPGTAEGDPPDFIPFEIVSRHEREARRVVRRAPRGRDWRPRHSHARDTVIWLAATAAGCAVSVAVIQVLAAAGIIG